MVRVARSRNFQQSLQHTLYMRSPEQITPARDKRNSLLRIIQNDCEMIGRGRLLACENHVAEQERIDRNGLLVAPPTGFDLFEGQSEDSRCGCAAVEAQRVRHS